MNPILPLYPFNPKPIPILKVWGPVYIVKQPLVSPPPQQQRHQRSIHEIYPFIDNQRNNQQSTLVASNGYTHYQSQSDNRGNSGMNGINSNNGEMISVPQIDMNRRQLSSLPPLPTFETVPTNSDTGAYIGTQVNADNNGYNASTTTTTPPNHSNVGIISDVFQSSDIGFNNSRLSLPPLPIFATVPTTEMPALEMPSLNDGNTNINGAIVGRRRRRLGLRKKYWSIVDRVVATNDNGRSDQKPFKCPFGNCGVRVISKNELLSHYRRHTEFAYVCTVCGRTFSRSGNLTDHSRTHTNEKPYECHICHKKLSQQHSLTEHLRKHSPQNKIKCHYCVKTFVSVSNRNYHTRSVCRVYKNIISQ